MDVTACPSQGVGAAQNLFLMLLQTLVKTHCSVASRDEWPQDAGGSAAQLHQFDFIVVGAGSGGSAVAGRLAENRDWNVLLIEAGGDPPIESEVINRNHIISIN